MNHEIQEHPLLPFFRPKPYKNKRKGEKHFLNLLQLAITSLSLHVQYKRSVKINFNIYCYLKYLCKLRFFAGKYCMDAVNSILGLTRGSLFSFMMQHWKQSTKQLCNKTNRQRDKYLCTN